MALMHVFIDSNGGMVVIPAPGPLGPDGPVFAGASPADESISVRGYELELDDDLVRTAGEADEDRLREQIERKLQQPERLRTVQPFTLNG